MRSGSSFEVVFREAPGCKASEFGAWARTEALTLGCGGSKKVLHIYIYIYILERERETEREREREREREIYIYMVTPPGHALISIHTTFYCRNYANFLSFYYVYIKSTCFFNIKTSIFSMFCTEKPVKPTENTYLHIFNYFSFIILGPKIPKSKNPKFSERYQTEFWIFGFLDFWISGFLDFWIFWFLDV